MARRRAPGSLAEAAATQQEADIIVPARRGTISDRSGVELAVSQPAVDIAATPYLIDDPPRIAARLARILHKPEDELLRELVRRTPASRTSRAACRPPAHAASSGSTSRGWS